ncbi:T9SS type A sorting domain-containing protein [Pseudobacter ginsenosidimutans]|uniref:Putative secreted protein (Por secretion system target) n=1 Tax=Pseudobacter ginsenosidimutans TaxID=661488 RepID=A0A4Q7N098_9BACT|nr:T9SS type A sorting domain-containing protein [Pseudobacter ginsenosidimutans]QEC43601.1 T9SS type A sorting domain-containing protein [Pseudobacter ginsenosidimutans]RZS75000.1 putative secreted protein (Por secretion system target) [Pseudobacter ginsenosidimutans]
MKTIISCFIPVCLAVAVKAQQIKITAGTSLRTSKQLQLVLSQGMDLENNADLQLPTLQVLASGTADSRISGTGMLTIGQLQINKQAGSKLILEKDCSIAGEVNFVEGFLDLNDHTLHLQPNAILKNEQAGSRIIGNNGGTVQITINLEQPSNLNPGNLGLIISTAAEPGITVIRRSHQVFRNGGGSSINRSYELSPENNTGLNASITMQYFDEELNGLNESLLELYQSPNNGKSWYARGLRERNISTNEVSADLIASLNTFTLSTINNPLPIKLSSISISCNSNQPTIKWKTVNPQDVQSFRIQKSINGIQWETVTGNIHPQPSSQHEYSYTDQQLPAKYYRIQSLEHNGEISYSAQLRTDCKGKGNSFSLLLNPVKETLQLNITANDPKQLGLQIIDPQGRIIRKISVEIQSGHSIQSIPLPAGANGLYHIRITEKGETVWTKTFLKV